MPKDMQADARIEAIAGKPVELPSGQFIASAEMTREGMDLHLTSPDGHTIVVENYFAQDPAPDLITADGGRLSPQLVDSFLPPEHVGQYAASGQTANDASPAGKITEVVGEATIVHADGTRVPATVGAPIFPGDVIETSKTGAVNILFADNTTFAISESARLSVDQFVYDSASHSGSTFFSMLQGMFVYTSGLIGKSDPGSVSIETPVGNIGIRGTVVVGHILPAGQESTITILDGAVTLTNATGTQELNTSFQTFALNSYQDQPETTQMNAQTFNTTYHSVSSVAGGAMGHFNGMVPQNDSTQPADHSPDSPDGNVMPSPDDGSVQPMDGPALLQDGGESLEGPKMMGPDGMMMAPAEDGIIADTAGMMPMSEDGTLMLAGDMPDGPFPSMMMGDMYGMYGMMPPPADMGFGMLPGMYGSMMPLPPAGSEFVMTGDMYGMMPPPDGMEGDMMMGDMFFMPPPDFYYGEMYAPLPPPTDSSTSPNFSVGFMFSPQYTNLTPDVSDDGIREFASPGTIVGMVAPFNANGAVTYQLIVTHGNPTDPTLKITPDTGAGGVYTTTTANLANIFSIDNTTGIVTVNEPGVLSHYLNQSGFNLRIIATDETNNTFTTDRYIKIQDFLPGTNPKVSSNGSQTGGTGADFLANNNVTASTIDGGGGADVLIGGNGNNVMKIYYDEFRLADGGSGDDTVYIGSASSNRVIVGPDGLTNVGELRNIETINLGLSMDGSCTYGNQLTLSLGEVFDMTDERHVLNIVADAGAIYSGMNVITGGPGEFQLFSGAIGTTPIVEYRGVHEGQLVRLVINQTITPNASGGIIVTNTVVTPSVSLSLNPLLGRTDTDINEFAGTGSFIGQLTASGPVDHYSVAVAATDASNLPKYYNGSTPENIANYAGVFSVDAMGNLRVDNRMAMSHNLNPDGFDLTITAYDSSGNALATINPHVDLRDYNGPTTDIAPTMFAVGNYTAPAASADYIVCIAPGNANLFGNGGADVIIGNFADNIISVLDPSFAFVDGGGGFDTLVFGSTADARISMDFAGNSDLAPITNIEKFDLGLSNVPGGGPNWKGSIITLNIKDVFEMTGPNHTLDIYAATNSVESQVDVVTAGFTSITGMRGVEGTGSPIMNYQGNYNGVNVTLIIHQNNTSGNAAGDITVNHI